MITMIYKKLIKVKKVFSIIINFNNVSIDDDKDIILFPVTQYNNCKFEQLLLVKVLMIQLNQINQYK